MVQYVVGIHNVACSCFWGVVEAMFFRCFGWYGGGFCSRRTVLLAASLARPRPVSSPCAATRPARGMSGFWTRQVFFLRETCLKIALTVDGML